MEKTFELEPRLVAAESSPMVGSAFDSDLSRRLSRVRIEGMGGDGATVAPRRMGIEPAISDPRLAEVPPCCCMPALCLMSSLGVRFAKRPSIPVPSPLPLGSPRLEFQTSSVLRRRPEREP